MASFKRALSKAYRARDQIETAASVVSTVKHGPTRTGHTEMRVTSDQLQANVTYIVSNHRRLKNRQGALVDRGANGGIVGKDAKVFNIHSRRVSVTGIDNHEMSSLKIVDASAKTISNRGPVIVILQQYAYHGDGNTIHSACQLEHFKNLVNDRSMKVPGGRQCIQTHDGYILPLDIIQGLPYLPMEPHKPEEWNTLPHVILTSAEDWEPTVLDNNLS
eukprot:350479-Chlamydomonas_euryale.AAC.2